MSWELYHTRASSIPGGEPCGRVAMRFSKKPVVGHVVMASAVEWPEVQAGDVMRCGSCGQGIVPRTDDLREAG